MTLLRYGPLTALEQPLLNKFYKSQGSPMRAPAEGQLWVARAEEIVAGLSLSPVPGGYWLTGLWVARNRRGQKIAGALIETALQFAKGTTWLFCHPDLQVFYQQQDFSNCTQLPAELAERLARYQRSKPLLAMARAQSSLPASSPGNNTSV